MRADSQILQDDPRERETVSKRWHVGTLTYTTAGLMVLFGWLLWGDLAWSLRERSVIFTVQILLKKFGASDTLTGLLIGTLPSLCSMILGPIVSYRSDRHRGRWGRRIPYLIAPTPVIVVAMCGLAFSPSLGFVIDKSMGDWSPGINFCTLALLGFFWLLFEIAINIAGQVVFFGLINDVVPQPLLGRFFGLFRAFSLLAAIVFNLWLLGQAADHYMWIFIGFGVLYGAGFTAMCLNVKEGQYPAPPMVEDCRPRGFLAAARTYLQGCFGHSYYWWVFAALSLPLLMVSPIWVFGIYFAQSVQMEMGTYGKYMTLMFIISFFLSYPLGMLADRYHPLRIGLVTLVFFTGVTLWGGLYARDAATYGIALVAQGVLAGVWQTGTASLAQRLFPRERFAQFSSAQWIVFGCANMVLVPLVGRFLDYTGHVYRYTFLMASVLGLVSLVVWLILYRKFNALGGVKEYVAP